MKSLLKKALAVSILGVGLFSVQLPSAEAAPAHRVVDSGGPAKKEPTYKQQKAVAKHVVRYYSPRGFSGGGSPLTKRTFK